jgi:hypothetical protein
VGGQEVSFRHAPSFEHLANQGDAPFIFEAFASTVPDAAVRNGVQALAQVALADPGGSGPIGLGYVTQRLDRVPSGPKAVGALTKAWFVNGCQALGHRRLHDAIPASRETSGAPTGVPLRDIHPADRLWSVLVVSELLGQAVQPTFIALLSCWAVDAGRSPASVLAYAFPGVSQQPLGEDQTIQLAEPFGRLGRREGAKMFKCTAGVAHAV